MTPYIIQLSDSWNSLTITVVTSICNGILMEVHYLCLMSLYCVVCLFEIVDYEA